MACSVCKRLNAKSMKHLPLPNGRNGWIELSKWTEYCTPCAEKAAVEATEAYQKAKESVKNG